MISKIIDISLSMIKRDKYKYRIQNEDRTFKNTGTGLESWFSLEEAKEQVNYSIGQRIVEHDGVNALWEVL